MLLSCAALSRRAQWGCLLHYAHAAVRAVSACTCHADIINVCVKRCQFGDVVLHLQVAAIRLTTDPFSVENGTLTPTFKLKRPQAKALYEEAIQEMYSTLKS